MTNRRLIRPNLAEVKDREFNRPRRKTPPPEITNAEEFYYVKQIGAGTPMVVVLNDGERIDGILEWYDRGCLKINRDDAPDLLLMKHAIRYMHKQEEDDDEA